MKRPIWCIKHHVKLCASSTVSSAFTIVELLVVIVVIAILAVISIVSYTGISQQAVTASLQADLSNAATAIKAFQVENGNFPATISTNCSSNPDTATNKCIRPSGSNTYVGYSADNQSSPKTFLLVASNGSTAYRVTDNSAPTQLAQTMQPGVTPGATIELHAAKANGGVSQGINSPLTTTWADTSGNGNNGSLQTFAGTAASGWTGANSSADPYRLVPDGSNDYVTLTSPISLSPDASSIEFWFKVVLGFSDIAGRSTDTSWFGLDDTSPPRFEVMDGNWNGRYFSLPQNLSAGEIHHIVVTRSNGTTRLYLNSVESGSGGWSNSYTITVNQLWKWRDGTYGYWGTCPLSVVRVYPFVLTTAQITANYAAGPNW